MPASGAVNSTARQAPRCRSSRIAIAVVLPRCSMSTVASQAPGEGQLATTRRIRGLSAGWGGSRRSCAASRRNVAGDSSGRSWVSDRRPLRTSSQARTSSPASRAGSGAGGRRVSGRRLLAGRSRVVTAVLLARCPHRRRRRCRHRSGRAACPRPQSRRGGVAATRCAVRRRSNGSARPSGRPLRRAPR